jgi:hypothetical protein
MASEQDHHTLDTQNTAGNKAAHEMEEFKRPAMEASRKSPQPAAEGDVLVLEDESRYVTGRKLAVLFSAFLLSVFLVALDQTIVRPS